MARNEPRPPIVSVVIPTIRRPQLVTRAVDSVLRQTLRDLEVVVVVDGPDDATMQALRHIDDGRLRIVALPEGLGVGAARGAGVDAARSRWVALLDDDDEWLSDKIEIQLNAAQRSRYSQPIISCRFVARTEHGDVILPRRLPRSDEPLSEYLFCQTGLLGGEGIILPSTILAPTELLRRTRFRYRHMACEGSDWVLRASRDERVGVEFVHTDAPLAIWHTDDRLGQMSNATPWHSSLEWVHANAELFTPRARASYILIRTSLEARRARGWRAFWLLPLLSFRSGRPTLIALLAHASIWLVPSRVRFRLSAVLTRILARDRADQPAAGAQRVLDASTTVNTVSATLRSHPVPVNPRVSIIIASYNSEGTIERCLRSLEQQDQPDAYEVIVVDSSTDGTADLIARQFPRVRLFRCADRKFPGDARNIGVAGARGDIIAFTDADCWVEPTWVGLVLRAHEENLNAVIGGAVENGNPESFVGWAYYFTEFTKWMPQSSPCEMADIPTTCLTLKRWIFDAYGPFLERTYCSDTAFNWKVDRNGYRPLFLPTLRVSHINITTLPAFVRRNVFHGTCFARVRTVAKGFSTRRRMAYVALAPLLPVLLFGRLVRSVVAKRIHVGRFAVASPLVMLGLVAWSWGELIGYLSPHPRVEA